MRSSLSVLLCPIIYVLLSCLLDSGSVDHLCGEVHLVKKKKKKKAKFYDFMFKRFAPSSFEKLTAKPLLCFHLNLLSD